MVSLKDCDKHMWEAAITDTPCPYCRIEELEAALKTLLQVSCFRGDRLPLRDTRVNSWFTKANKALKGDGNEVL